MGFITTTGYLLSGKRRGPHPKSIRARMDRKKAMKKAIRSQIKYETKLRDARRRAGLI